VDEARLIKNLRDDNDRDSARALLQSYEQPLFHYIYRMLGHHQDAEDALSETFTKVLRGLLSERYQEQQQFKAWIYRIARNEAINIIRRRERTTVQEDPAEHVPDPSPASAVAEAVMNVELKKLLWDAIATLPTGEREVLVLRLKSDLSFREIAEITGSALNTVLGRMHNAKKRLRNFMLEEVNE